MPRPGYLARQRQALKVGSIRPKGVPGHCHHCGRLLGTETKEVTLASNPRRPVRVHPDCAEPARQAAEFITARIAQEREQFRK